MPSWQHICPGALAVHSSTGCPTHRNAPLSSSLYLNHYQDIVRLANLQFSRLLLEPGDTVSSRQQDSWRDQRTPAFVPGSTRVIGLLVLNLHVEGLWLSIALTDHLLGEHSTHVRPFPKLGLVLGEALDPCSQTVLVPLATLGSIGLHWWRGRGHKVRVLITYMCEK